ncbi:MAG TPA: hypothetical protein DCY35_09195, partial [Prolixibacteraceae bacterium]|nr:hypothetical protein [Prolixibacteraceae bacterium]
MPSLNEGIARHRSFPVIPAFPPFSLRLHSHFSYIYTQVQTICNFLPMGKFDEKDILMRLRNSDKDALKDIFEAFYPSLCHYASHFLGDHDQSEEVVQDLFVRIWEKRETVVVSTSLRSYLFRSVRNQCINLIMHEKVRQNHAKKIRDAIIEDAAEEDYFLEEEKSKAISSAIAALPDKRREIFLLSRQEGLKY